MPAEFSPSPIYDAVAKALSPLSSDGVIPLNVAVKAAAQAIEAEVVTILDVLNIEMAKVTSLSDTIVSERAEHERAIAAYEAQFASARTEAANAVAAAQGALARQAERIEALEKVYVMAAARWNFEGGPALIREALEACDVR